MPVEATATSPPPQSSRLLLRLVAVLLTAAIALSIANDASFIGSLGRHVASTATAGSKSTPAPSLPRPPPRTPSLSTAGGSSGPKATATVSILSLSNGQHWCDRNLIQNACYQDYDKSLLELVIAETSPLPSPVLVEAHRTDSWGCLKTRHIWFNSSDPAGELNPSLGELRTRLAAASTNEILINMDNDDFYHPSFVGTIVAAMDEFRNPAYVPASKAQAAGNRMFKPAVVMTHAHLRGHLRPDGSLFVDWDKDSRQWGSHQTSLTRAVYDVCGRRTHGNAGLNEEKGLHDGCILENNLTLRRLPTAVGFVKGGKNGVQRVHGPPYDNKDTRGSLPWDAAKGTWRVVDDDSNAMLLVKFDSGLSITRQRWKIGRSTYNMLTEKDWQDVLSMQAWHYEQWHELSRPRGLARLPYFDPPSQLYNDEDKEKLPPGRFRRHTPHLGTPLTESSWKSFWERNNNLFQRSEASGGSQVTDIFKHFARSVGSMWTTTESLAVAAASEAASLDRKRRVIDALTCQGISDEFGTNHETRSYGSASPEARKFWAEHKCTTVPKKK